MSGDDLFSMADERSGQGYAPLAVRMRPESLDDIYGQDDLIGPGSFLRTLIEKDTIPSLLFYGPSGVGKTTLAHVIANETDSRFVTLNAVTAGTAELRKVIAAAQDAIHLYQKRTILFIDEIHRFNKSQQDVLLPYVEDGTVILIGATTENPYFEVNRPLLSRLRVIQLKPLSEQAVTAVLRRALTDREKGLGSLGISASDEMLGTLARLADRDARVGLNLRAVGESPATADAAGINVNRYKYIATCVGSMIAGLGGLYYVMDYACGVWSNDAFGDRGWLAIALVIFSIWRPNLAIIASILFGGLYIVYLYIPAGTQLYMMELYKMLPYLVTIIVLVVVSMRKKRENEPPAALGLAYFREER